MDESIEEDHLLFYPKGKYAVAETYELHSSIDSITKILQRKADVGQYVRLDPLSDRLVNNNCQEPSMYLLFFWFWSWSFLGVGLDLGLGRECFMYLLSGQRPYLRKV